MAVSYDTFEHFKERGITARRRGDYRGARVYLLQAAKAMTELAEQVNGDLRAERRRTALRLLELAKDCEEMSKAPPKGRKQGGSKAKASSEDDEESSAEDWVIREKPNITFQDVAGLDGVKAEIRLKMIYPASRPDLAQKFGIRSGGGLLMYGPPGCGKTMMARAVAGELDATFFTVTPAQILSKWVGQAEQNIQKLFEAARAEESAVIFIDEIEALVPKRHGQQSTVMARVVPQILTEIEGVAGRAQNALLFLAATNEPASLDPAVMRPGRFDEKVYIPLPDGPARFRMLEIFLGKLPLADDVDFGELCDKLDGFSGADIRRICEKAATIPFMEAVNGQEERPITRGDISLVMEASRPSVTPAQLARYEAFAAAE